MFGTTVPVGAGVDVGGWANGDSVLAMPHPAETRRTNTVACHAAAENVMPLRVSAATDSGQGQNRTADTGIFSAVLYQLSYLAAPFRMARSAPL